MKFRGGAREKRDAEAQPFVPPTLGKKKDPKQNRTRKIMVRAFIAATCLFFLAVGIWSVSSYATDQPVSPIVASDLATLKEMTARLRERTAISTFNEMLETSMHIGCAAELMLLQLVSDEEATERANAAHLHGEAAKRASPKVDARVLRGYRKQLPDAAASLSEAADIAYTKLDGILRKFPSANLRLMSSSLPRTLFNWVAETVHLYNAVLTEYYLFTDESAPHARALLRAVNLLTSSSELDSLFNWSRMPCQRVFRGVTSEWTRFCETSLETKQATVTRRAADFEELIALYPQYAPFRLHYAVLLILGDATGAPSPRHLRVIRGQEEQLPSYSAPDPVHKDVLTLLEVYATPLEQLSPVVQQAASELLTSSFTSCDSWRMDSSPDTDTTWPAPFNDQRRPPLFDREHLTLLLVKLRLVYGPESTVLRSLTACLS